jgi:hypothetical protein
MAPGTTLCTGLPRVGITPTGYYGVTKGAGAPRVEEVDEKKDPLEYIPRPTRVSSATVGSGG